MKLEKLIEDALVKAARILPDDVEKEIRKAQKSETSPSGSLALNAIVENINIAKETGIPLCQDTGMFWCLAEIGRSARVNLALLESAIIKGAKNASLKGFYRKSVVEDPIYERKNTGTNLPVVINYALVDGENITLNFLLKGFGSENCSQIRMLNPTAGEQGVVDAIEEMMKLAGGKPCPPCFIGIGVGGTMDRAAFLSKKAFFKKGKESELEKGIKARLNALSIGPGGLGGDNTVLSVQLLSEPTHIAGLPVAMTVNCWADRKAQVVILGGYDE